MNPYLKSDEWCIVEEGFNPENNKSSESIFSLGNGRMGQRANFEEYYSGPTFQGNYVAGVYYPDKTRVGWWKNGYPEYFAKVLNASNWIGINLKIDETPLDLNTCKIENFTRTLNMREGYLERVFTAILPNGKKIEVNTRRFLSLSLPELGAIRYSIRFPEQNAWLTASPYVDFDVINHDSNYNEKFWDEVERFAGESDGYVTAKTKKLDFHVCTRMLFDVKINGHTIVPVIQKAEKEKYVENTFSVECAKGAELVIYKYAAILSSENHKIADLAKNASNLLDKARAIGFEELAAQHAEKWLHRWESSDIVIEGDAAAQQGIRFNIFQLNQTYTGEDPRLNIGPKGFTGEKYGGSTYWDTEAYCLPFYMSTANPEVARNLLMYRYKHLTKAIENGQKLGFKNGAALYPMVTMNGEECHNEWEITFEEIHRNGAIAYAIYNYTRYTGDKDYLINYGIEVLLGISRFWAQRVNFSEEKKKYVMLGVTGPNEYENNANNNWYTNYIACWCMKYTSETLALIQTAHPAKFKDLAAKTKLDLAAESAKWNDIVKNMYFPYHEKLNVFLQQEGYMDKEQILASQLDPAERPINQHWSWDRILRSCFIKQGDVLQGLYFFESDFDTETIRRNFDFYEPRTVHESSLSPAIHSVLASKIGYAEKAYEMYLRTSRLDLDDYNNEVREGLHITSMAGTWLSIVEGFGGMRVKNDKLHFNPSIPPQWQSISFEIKFRGSLVKMSVSATQAEIKNQSDKTISVVVYDSEKTILPYQSVEIPRK